MARRTVPLCAALLVLGLFCLPPRLVQSGSSLTQLSAETLAAFCGSTNATCLQNLQWTVTGLGASGACIGPPAVVGQPSPCNFTSVQEYLDGNVDTDKFSLQALHITTDSLSIGTANSYTSDLAHAWSSLRSLRITCTAPRPTFAAFTLGNIIRLLSNMNVDGVATSEPALEVLIVSGCGLAGQLPASLRYLTHLKRLDLSANLITEPLPLLITQPAPHINMSGNMISGTVDVEWAALGSCGGVIDMSNNLLEGPIPAALLQSSCSMTNKRPDGLACQPLDGSPCPIDGAVWGSVPSLTLSGMDIVLQTLYAPAGGAASIGNASSSTPTALPDWWPSVWGPSVNSTWGPNQDNTSLSARATDCALPSINLASGSTATQPFRFSVLLYNNPGLMQHHDSAMYAVAAAQRIILPGFQDNACTRVDTTRITIMVADTWAAAFVLGGVLGWFTSLSGTSSGSDAIHDQLQLDDVREAATPSLRQRAQSTVLLLLFLGQLIAPSALAYALLQSSRLSWGGPAHGIHCWQHAYLGPLLCLVIPFIVSCVLLSRVLKRVQAGSTWDFPAGEPIATLHTVTELSASSHSLDGSFSGSDNSGIIYREQFSGVTSPSVSIVMCVSRDVSCDNLSHHQQTHQRLELLHVYAVLHLHTSAVLSAAPLAVLVTCLLCLSPHWGRNSLPVTNAYPVCLGMCVGLLGWWSVELARRCRCLKSYIAAWVL